MTSRVEGDDTGSRFHFLGVIFGPDLLPPHPQLASHVSNPTPLHLGGAEYRVFYAARDDKNRSSLAYFDFDVDATAVTNIGQEPLFSYGEPETFFSHGVTPGSTYEAAGQLWLSFMGWEIPGDGEHWRGKIGLLNLGKRNSKASLHSTEPLLGRGGGDAVSLSYPGIIRLDTGDFLMIYRSPVTWGAGNGEMVDGMTVTGSSEGFDWHSVGSHCARYHCTAGQLPDSTSDGDS